MQKRTVTAGAIVAPDYSSIRITREQLNRMQVLRDQRREETGYRAYSMDNLLSDMLALWERTEAESLVDVDVTPAPLPDRLSRARGAKATRRK